MQFVPIGAAARAANRLVPCATLIAYEASPHRITDTHKARLSDDMLRLRRG
jgi:non-heme chloroperoxidase